MHRLIPQNKIFAKVKSLRNFHSPPNIRFLKYSKPPLSLKKSRKGSILTIYLTRQTNPRQTPRSKVTKRSIFTDSWLWKWRIRESTKKSNNNNYSSVHQWCILNRTTTRSSLNFQRLPTRPHSPQPNSSNSYKFSRMSFRRSKNRTI